MRPVGCCDLYAFDTDLYAFLRSCLHTLCTTTSLHWSRRFRYIPSADVGGEMSEGGGVVVALFVASNMLTEEQLV